ACQSGTHLSLRIIEEETGEQVMRPMDVRYVQPFDRFGSPLPEIVVESFVLPPGERLELTVRPSRDIVEVSSPYHETVRLQVRGRNLYVTPGLSRGVTPELNWAQMIWGQLEFDHKHAQIQ